MPCIIRTNWIHLSSFPSTRFNWKFYQSVHFIDFFSRYAIQTSFGPNSVNLHQAATKRPTSEARPVIASAVTFDTESWFSKLIYTHVAIQNKIWSRFYVFFLKAERRWRGGGEGEDKWTLLLFPCVKTSKSYWMLTDQSLWGRIKKNNVLTKKNEKRNRKLNK